MKILIFDLSDYHQSARDFFRAIDGTELQFFNDYMPPEFWVDVDGIIVRSQIGPYYPRPVGVLVGLQARALGIPCVIQISDNQSDGWIRDTFHDLREFGEVGVISNHQHSRDWVTAWVTLLNLGLPYRIPKTED